MAEGFLRWIELPEDRRGTGRPFSIAALRALRSLELHPAVTVLVGDRAGRR